MARAKECDICKALYKDANNPEVMKSTGYEYSAVIMQVRKGKENLDVCTACRRTIAKDLVDHYSK